MFKCAVSGVNSIVPTGSTFRLPELFKILKNHTNKIHNILVAHQSGMLLMLIIPCIVNKKKPNAPYYLLLRINIWLIMITVNYGGRDQFLEQKLIWCCQKGRCWNLIIRSAVQHSDLTQSLQSVSYVFMRGANSHSSPQYPL